MDWIQSMREWVQSDATTRRRQRYAQGQSITDRRITIQFAADAGISDESFLP